MPRRLPPKDRHKYQAVLFIWITCKDKSPEWCYRFLQNFAVKAARRLGEPMPQPLYSDEG